MAYRMYSTEGIVLGKKNIGEANQILHIFTKDLGLVRAVATGVRLEKAKLKNHIQLFSWISMQCVRGKDTWRLTSAGTLADRYPNSVDDRLKLKNIYIDITKLLRHFGVYDVPQKELYGCIKDIFTHYTEIGATEKTLRLVVPLLMLYTLGYISHDFAKQCHCESLELCFAYVDGHKKEIKSVIEKTLEQVST